MFRKLRVVVDAVALSDAGTFGVNTYTVGLVEALSALDDVEVLLLYPWPLHHGTAKLARAGIRQIRFAVPGAKTKEWEQMLVPLLSLTTRCHLIHSPANVAPVLSPKPVVLTLHDIISYSGHSNISADSQRYLDTYGTRGVRRASAIITVSEFSRRQIAGFFGIDEAKIHVIFNAAAPEFFASGPKQAPNCDKPIILGCGSLAPTKNARSTLMAFARIYAKYPGSKLMLFSVSSGSENTLRKLCATAEVPEDAIGFVSAPDDLSMSRVFAQSDLLLFPSLWEGFGMPVAEAFAAGTPVVTSREGALQEVSGGAALLVDPNDPAAIAEAAIGMLENTDLWNKMCNLGRQRATFFTWQRVAAQTAEIYRRVVTKEVL